MRPLWFARTLRAPSRASCCHYVSAIPWRRAASPSAAQSPTRKTSPASSSSWRDAARAATAKYSHLWFKYVKHFGLNKQIKSGIELQILPSLSARIPVPPGRTTGNEFMVKVWPLKNQSPLKAWGPEPVREIEFSLLYIPKELGWRSGVRTFLLLLETDFHPAEKKIQILAKFSNENPWNIFGTPCLKYGFWLSSQTSCLIFFFFFFFWNWNAGAERWFLTSSLNGTARTCALRLELILMWSPLPKRRMGTGAGGGYAGSGGMYTGGGDRRFPLCKHNGAKMLLLLCDVHCTRETGAQSVAVKLNGGPMPVLFRIFGLGWKATTHGGEKERRQNKTTQSCLSARFPKQSKNFLTRE